MSALEEAAIQNAATKEHWVVIRTSMDPAGLSFRDIKPGTRLVHICGYPNLQTLERILELAPDLQKIRIPPTSDASLPSRFRSRCAEKDIEIVVGTARWESKR